MFKRRVNEHNQAPFLPLILLINKLSHLEALVNINIQIFRRIDRGDEHYADRVAGCVEGFIRLLVEIIGFV